MDRVAPERKKLSEQVRDLENQLEGLRCERAEEIAKLTSEKKALQDRLRDAESQILQLKSAEAGRKRSDEEPKRYATENMTREEIRQSLEDEIRRLRRTVGQTEGEKREKEERIAEYEERIHGMQARLEAYQEYIQSLDTQLREEMSRHAPMYGAGLDVLSMTELETMSRIHEEGLRQVHATQQQRVGMHHSNGHVNDELKKVVEEKDAFAERLKSVEAGRKRFDEELKRYQTENVTREEIRPLEDEIRRLRQTVGQTEGEKREKEERIAEYEERINGMQARLEAYKEYIQSLDTQLREEMSRHAHLYGAPLDALSMTELEMISRIHEEGLRQIHTIQQQRVGMHHSNGHVNDELRQTVGQTEGEEREKEERIAEYEERIHGMQARLEACQECIQSLDTQLREDMSRHAPLYGAGLDALSMKELETISHIHEEGLRQIHAIQQQHVGMHHSTGHVNDELKKVAEEKDPLAERLKSAEAGRKRSDEELKRYEMENVTGEEIRQSLEDEIRRLRETVGQTEGEKRKKEEKIAEYKERINGMQARLEAYQEYIQSLDTQLREEMSRHAPLYGAGLDALSMTELETISRIHEEGLRQIHAIQQQRKGSPLSSPIMSPHTLPLHNHGLYPTTPPQVAAGLPPSVMPNGIGMHHSNRHVNSAMGPWFNHK